MAFAHFRTEQGAPVELAVKLGKTGKIVALVFVSAGPCEPFCVGGIVIACPVSQRCFMAPGEKSVGVTDVKSHAFPDLSQIVGTGDGASPSPGLLQSGQQHSRQNSDDSDHDEKFDQSKFSAHKKSCVSYLMSKYNR
jgi:hypothetical protein